MFWLPLVLEKIMPKAFLYKETAIPDGYLNGF